MSLMKRSTTSILTRPCAGADCRHRGAGYRPEQIITQFMLSVWCGANRFEHGEVTRHDPVLRRLYGIARMANFKAVMRLFRKFRLTSKSYPAGCDFFTLGQ
jgi:hypothetical protein